MSPPEVWVPCILWGEGIPAGAVPSEQRSLLDVSPTISHFLGVLPPRQSTGQVLGVPESDERPVVVVIPAHNEAERLPQVLTAIPQDPNLPLQVIVVDDGSTDATTEVARRWGAEVVRHDRNRGLGAALRTGLAVARDRHARAAVYLDADGEYDPKEIPLLLAPIERGEADYVLGSRYRGERQGQALSRHIANRLFTLALCVLSGRRISDGQTGFRAFSGRALEVAEIVHDYNYAQVLTLDLLKKGMRLAEVPISYRRRQSGKSFVNAAYLWRVPLGIARELLSE
jgi:glycosyltransferase involved in cell wall biosynthesis